MPKYLLVDGFNVIRRDARFGSSEEDDFYGTQAKLIQMLAHYRSGTFHRIVVVFDGARGPNPYRGRSQQQGIEVVFSSRGETADEVIQDMVAGHAPRQGVLVATADRRLALRCRQLGATIVAPEELLKAGRNPKPTEMDKDAPEAGGAWAGTTKKRGNPRRLPKNRRKTRGLW